MLVESEEDPGPLLHAAVKQQLVPEALRTPPDSTKTVHIVHNIMLPDPKTDPRVLSKADGQCYAIPESKLTFGVMRTGAAMSVFNANVPSSLIQQLKLLLQ